MVLDSVQRPATLTTPRFLFFKVTIMQTNLEGKEALPLMDPVKGYLGCWSPAGGVMGPCLHCARNPYRLRKEDNVSKFGSANCWGSVGFHHADSSGNDLHTGHDDARAQFIYVPHDAVSMTEAGVVRFKWESAWFQEAAALVRGCGDETSVGCDYGFRVCAHCWNHGGTNCHKEFMESKRSGRGIMKRKYVTRNGTVII